MLIHILKTDIKTIEAVEHIGPLLNLHPSIRQWTVDTEDIDNVLRIESEESLAENQILTLLNQYGIISEPLNS